MVSPEQEEELDAILDNIDKLADEIVTDGEEKRKTPATDAFSQKRFRQTKAAFEQLCEEAEEPPEEEEIDEINNKLKLPARKSFWPFGKTAFG